jgi:hypothetical protein
VTYQLPSNYSSLTVTWSSESSGYATNATITADVKSIPIFTDTGTGEVNQARIILRALDGNYITSGNIIDIHDRFQIECTDLGGNSYDRTFEVIDIIPSQSKSEGTLLTLDCLGIEYHTQQIHMSKPYYFENAFNVVKDIGDIYEENNGSKQPLISSHDSVWNNTLGNDAPKYTVNNYEYGIAEDSCYNRWMDVLEKLGASVSSGGALTFFELSFTTPTVNQIALRFRASGDNTPTVTLKNAKVTNPKTVGEQEGMLSNPTGTNVLAWGSPEHGTLPVGYSKYFSGTEFFTFRPEWVSGLTGGYPQDAIVKVTTASTQISKHYISLVDSNTQTPGNPSFWTQIDMSDSQGEVNGDNVQYSPWTDGKAQYWKNSMANPSGTTNFAWDCNLVIWDDGYFRTWVDARATSDSALTSLIDNGSANEGYAFDYTDVTTLPRGFRVLVDSGSSSPSDALANFGNMIAEWTGSEWRKKYSFDSTNDKVQIAVLDEAKIYQGDNFGTTPTWTALDTADYGNDCFHPVTSITNTTGIDLVNGVARPDITDSTNHPDITKYGSPFGTNIDSALKFTYTWNSIGSADINTQTGDYYKRGGWANFRLPYPVNDYNTISDTVGGLYKPSTIDLQNMHNLSDGNRGFNQGDSSEDLGAINGVAFWLKFSNSSVADIDANDQFRVFMIDTSDNVVYADFNIEFRDHWEDIRIPISSFRVYRGRTPAHGLDNAFTLVPPKDLSAVNQFEPRNVKFVGIQWQLSYDEYDRYNPVAATIESGSVETLVNAVAGGTIDLYIDGFRFTKPLLVTSGKNLTRNLEPNFLQRGNITNYWQLLNDAKSQLEIEQFRHKEYNIETSGDDIFDIPFGDSFLLENDNLVYLSSPNSNESTNKIQLVAKRVEYSITKPEQGIGGLRRRINGSKVFT